MNNNIASLLTNVYEIEGLLLVVSRHGKDTPSLVYQRIEKAAQDLNEQCKQFAAQASQQEPAAPVAEPQLVVQQPVVESEPEPQPEPVTEVLPVEDEPAQVPVEDREPDEDISFEFVYDEDTEQAADEEEPMERSEQDDDDMPSSPFSFQASESQQPVEDSVAPPMFNPEPQEAPRRTIDMRKSLSINDYYRFRRELFEGDEEEMNEALNAVMHMDSAAQVENYFYNVKGWNRDSDDVAYFMEIVHNLFD